MGLRPLLTLLTQAKAQMSERLSSQYVQSSSGLLTIVVMTLSYYWLQSEVTAGIDDSIKRKRFAFRLVTVGQVGKTQKEITETQPRVIAKIIACSFV